MLGVIVFAHGSRDPVWRQPVEAVALEIQAQAPGTLSSCAYLELCEPDLPTCAHRMIEQGASELRILPLFFGMGKHARDDLPQLLDQLREQFPQVAIHCLPAAGEHPAMRQLLARLAVGTIK